MNAQTVKLGAQIVTTRKIGHMLAGREGVVVRRNRRAVTMRTTTGIATVPYDAFELVADAD